MVQRFVTMKRGWEIFRLSRVTEERGFALGTAGKVNANALSGMKFGDFSRGLRYPTGASQCDS